MGRIYKLFAIFFLLARQTVAHAADTTHARMLALSVELTAWQGDGPYTVRIEDEATAEASTYPTVVLDAASLTALAADLSVETQDGAVVLTTESKPSAELTGYIILEEVSA